MLDSGHKKLNTSYLFHSMVCYELKINELFFKHENAQNTTF